MFNLKDTKKDQGFTLIELLVVISIIGLLSSVVLASLQSAKQKAKSSKIGQEINQLKIAFELYKNDKGKYPNEGISDRKCIAGSSFTAPCSEDPIVYLKRELVDNKYISSVTNNATPFLTYGNQMYYLTGSGPLYVYDYLNTPVEDYYAMCGGKILKGYMLGFYSDQKLNLPKPGYYYQGYYDTEYDPYSWDYNTNWYCIGE